MKARRIRGIARLLAFAGFLSMVAAVSEAAPQQTTGTPPIISLAASPTSVDAGGSSLLSWSTAYAQRCKASGGWSGRKSTQGTYATGPLTTTQTYALQCVGPGGTTSAKTTVQVASAPASTSTSPAPVTSLTANPTSIASGATSTLTWAATDADGCVASGAWSGSKAASGTLTVGPLTANSSFSAGVYGNRWYEFRDGNRHGATDGRTDPVAYRFAIERDQRWHLHADLEQHRCKRLYRERRLDGRASRLGYEKWLTTVGPLTTGATYTLACTGAGGTVTRSATITIAAPSPTLIFTASPLSVASGASSTLTWSATNATSCTGSGSWTGTKATSGTQTTGALTASASYMLTCTGGGGSVSQTAAVTVTAAPPTLTLTASPASVQSGASSNLTWSTTNATTCSASGAWNGAKGTSGTQSTGALTSNSSFTLACAGGGGTVTQTATVTVTAGTPSVTLSASPPGVSRNTNATLSWTSANLTGCAASGGWSGTKTISGSESVGPITQDTTYTLSCTGTSGNAVAMTTVTLREAVLSWQAPTKNVDGSTLTNLAGYKIYYGTASNNYTQTVSVSGASTTTWTLPLAPGTYYFALTAADSTGTESAKTSEVSKTIN